MNLQERLMGEAREACVVLVDADIDDLAQEIERHGESRPFIYADDLDAIIQHTIEQTIKEGCEVIEGMRTPHNFSAAASLHNDMVRNLVNQTLTDTQHALRGILK